MSQHADFTGSIPAATMIFSDVYASCFSFPRERDRGKERERDGERNFKKEDKQTERRYNWCSCSFLLFLDYSFFLFLDVLSSFFCLQRLFNCFYPMFINFRSVKPSAHFALTVIYGPPAECNAPGSRECNTQLHSAYTRVDEFEPWLKRRTFKCIFWLLSWRRSMDYLNDGVKAYVLLLARLSPDSSDRLFFVSAQGQNMGDSDHDTTLILYLLIPRVFLLSWNKFLHWTY